MATLRHAADLPRPAAGICEIDLGRTPALRRASQRRTALRAVRRRMMITLSKLTGDGGEEGVLVAAIAAERGFAAHHALDAGQQ